MENGKQHVKSEAQDPFVRLCCGTQLICEPVSGAPWGHICILLLQHKSSQSWWKNTHMPSPSCCTWVWSLGLAYTGSLLRVSPGKNPGVSQRWGLTWGSGPSRSLLGGKTHFLATVELRPPFLLFFLINFYWSIAALQCFVSFCSIARWISYIFTHIASFLDFLSI